jgi:hypothetical protein
MPLSRYTILMLLCGTLIALTALAMVTDQRLVLAGRSRPVADRWIVMAWAVLATLFWARVSYLGLMLSGFLALDLVLGSIFDWLSWDPQMPSVCQVLLIIASIVTTAYGWHQREYLREPHEPEQR